MSIFSDISDFLFGGTDTSAQELQRQANLEAQRAIDVGTKQARADVLGLFPEASQARNLGFQAALDVLGQSIPAQLQAFQQGNVGAQQNILAGLPQFRSAILGGQFDPTAFQPTTLGFDAGFAQQTLPTFTERAAPRTAVQQQQQAQQALSQLLAGAGNFSGVQSVPQQVGAEGLGGTTGVGPSGPSGTLSAQDLATMATFGKTLGLLGPVGSLASAGLNEAARQAANEAFSKQAPIGFFDDLLSLQSAFERQSAIAGQSTPAEIAQAAVNRQAVAAMGGGPGGLDIGSIGPQGLTSGQAAALGIGQAAVGAGATGTDFGGLDADIEAASDIGFGFG